MTVQELRDILADFDDNVDVLFVNVDTGIPEGILRVFAANVDAESMMASAVDNDDFACIEFMTVK